MRFFFCVLMVSIGVIMFGCADDDDGSELIEDDAATSGTSGSGSGAGGAGDVDGSAGNNAGVGGTNETGGTGQSNNKDAGLEASVNDAGTDTQLCPPCVSPPSPDCVGTGPCGCGPYKCPDAGGSSYNLRCESTNGDFPPFSKSCENDDDCVLLQHQTDCCGSFMMIGVSVSDQKNFESAESQCSSSLPLCDCLQQPIVAEDGFRANETGTFDVVCDENECYSTVDPEAISENDLAFCQRDSDCLVVPYSHCCGLTKTAINERFLDAYNNHPEWQVFNDPATCAVIGVCPDDTNVKNAVCEGAPLGVCRLEY